MKITLMVNRLNNGDYRAQIIQPPAMTREGPFHWKAERMPPALMEAIDAQVASGAAGPHCVALELTLKDLYAATLVH